MYQQFQDTFPLERLADMPLEDYTNLNKENSFCYWLESRTSDLGSIWGGSSYKFGIYRYKNKPSATDNRILCDDQYAWYAKYGKATAQEAYKLVLEAVKEVATAAREHNLEAIDNIDTLGDTVKWKIAFLYSEENLIPIYNHGMLEKLAAHFGLENPKERKNIRITTFPMGAERQCRFV